MPGVGASARESYRSKRQVWDFFQFGDRRGTWSMFRRAIFCQPPYEDEQRPLSFYYTTLLSFSLYETYRKRETEGWNRYMSVPELASRIRESGVSNLAQVYARVKYPMEENVRISRELLRSLTHHGFMGQDEEEEP